MIWLRSTLLVLLGLLAGAALTLAGGYWVGKTPQGQTLLRDFLVSQLPAFKPLPATTASSSPGVLPIPKADATQEYFLAINSVLQDTYALDNTNRQLGPVLDQLNTSTVSCTFSRFYDLMMQARSLANKNQTLVTQFLLHVSALEAANAQTKDAVTKSGTVAVVASGRAFGTALQSYATTLQELLHGDTPTSVQLADFQKKVTDATAASRMFADAFKPVLEHLVLEIQRFTATSTPAR